MKKVPVDPDAVLDQLGEGGVDDLLEYLVAQDWHPGRGGVRYLSSVSMTNLRFEG